MALIVVGINGYYCDNPSMKVDVALVVVGIHG